jgi:carbon storage regulator CsrA
MLVLTRKLNQRILLTLPNGDEITLNVAGIELARSGKTKQVKIGIIAPMNIKINREEAIRDVEPIKLQSGVLV